MSIELNSKLNEYLVKKSQSWSANTSRSEKSRLSRLLPTLQSLKPEDLLQVLRASGKAKYTIVTTWIRVEDFISFCEINPNPFSVFRKESPAVFRGAYVRKHPAVTLEEATRRLNEIKKVHVRDHAKLMLNTAMRFSESLTLNNGLVIGKGQKVREIFTDKSVNTINSVGNPIISYKEFWRELKKVGLKPHDLRKLCLSRLVELGANEYQLREIAGWSSLEPALSYIKTDKKKIRELMRRI